MSKVYGFGIIGAGLICNEHAKSIGLLKDRARLIGLADLDEARLRQKRERYFVPYTYTDYGEMLDRDDIDVVIIATPPSTHENLVIDVLKAGKHVICEKPIAHTLESTDRIIEAAAKYEHRFSVSYQSRFSSEVKRFIWLRDNGWLGDLKFGNFQWLDTFGNETTSNWWGKWAEAGGGVVITKFVHHLDMIVHVFGNPVSVYAEIDTLLQKIESEDTFAATIRFKNGAIVTCSSTVNAHNVNLVVDVIGSKGSVHLPWAVSAIDSKHHRQLMEAMKQAQMVSHTPKQSLQSRAVQLIKSRLGGESLPIKVMKKILPKLGIKILQTGPPPLQRLFIMEFLDAIQENKEVPVSGEEARKSMELCTAIYTSALSGIVVSLPLEESNPYYKGLTANIYRDRHKKYSNVQ